MLLGVCVLLSQPRSARMGSLYVWKSELPRCGAARAAGTAPRGAGLWVGFWRREAARVTKGGRGPPELTASSLGPSCSQQAALHQCPGWCCSGPLRATSGGNPARHPGAKEAGQRAAGVSDLRTPGEGERLMPPFRGSARHIPAYPDGIQAGGHFPSSAAAPAADHGECSCCLFLLCSSSLVRPPFFLILVVLSC